MTGPLLAVVANSPLALRSVGGKAAAAQRLMSIPGARTPISAVIPAPWIRSWFCAALKDRQLRRVATQWAAGDTNGPMHPAWAAHQLPAPLERALAKRFVHQRVLIVRSSAVKEDGAQRSLAGHYQSELCLREELATAVKNCVWSGVRSSFRYATSKRADPARRLQSAVGSLALLVQGAVDSERAGVIFTRSPLHADAMMVVANWGTCHSVVDGAFSTDTWLVRPRGVEADVSYKMEMTTLCPGDGAWPGQPLQTPLGPTHFHLPYGPRLAIARVPKTIAGLPALEDEQLNQVVAAAALIGAQLKTPVDVEWCFDEGDLVLLQARPVTASSVSKRSPGDADGRTASPGVAAGPVRILRSPSDIPQVDQGDVLVVTATDPEYLPALYKAAAVISEEGSPLSHTAIVARELGIPCLVGVGDATRGRFWDGAWVTVDADAGRVRAGAHRAAKLRAPAAQLPSALCVRASHLRELPARTASAITASALLDDCRARGLPGAPSISEVLAHLSGLEKRRHRRLRVEWDILIHPVEENFFQALRQALAGR